MVRILILAVGIAMLPCWGCSKTGGSTKRDAVLAWVEKKPAVPDLEHAMRPDAYATYEQWFQAGRKIEGLEAELLGLYREERGRVPTVVICDALYEFGTAQSIPVLTGIVRDPNEEFDARNQAILVLANIGDKSAVRPLCEFIVLGLPSDCRVAKYEFKRLKLAAIGALGVLGDPNALAYVDQAREQLALDEREREYLEESIASLRDWDNGSERRED